MPNHRFRNKLLSLRTALHPAFHRDDSKRSGNLAKRLGYGADARLLIVHADDLGMAQSINAGFFSGAATGLINSGSVMVPSPWFHEVASYAQANSTADIGLHLTLSTGSGAQRWRPAAPPDEIPSLIDAEGYLLRTWTRATAIDPREVQIELRAQIETAYAAGLHPTHLDSHQFRLQLATRELFEVYLGLARAYRLPAQLTREWFAPCPYIEPSLGADDVLLDHIVIINPKVAPDQWSFFYRSAVRQLPAGVSEFLIHPGQDTEELRRHFAAGSAWGAEWRQRDLTFFTSDEFRDLIREERVELVTWRDIASRLA